MTTSVRPQPSAPPRAAVAPRRRSQRWRGAVVLLRRLLFYVATAWVAITLNFVIPRLMPGDPATIVVNRLAQRQPVTAATETAIRALFGTPDESLWRQYVQYIGELAHGNFGISIAFYPQPVSTVISQGLPWTLALVGLSTVVAFLIGTLLGVVAGMRPGNRFDSVLAPLSTFLGAMPYFWVGTVVLLLLSVQWPAFPSQNGADLSLDPGWTPEFIGSVIYHGTLPALTIVLTAVGGWFLGADPVGAIAVTAGVCVSAAISTGGWLTLARFAWAGLAGLAVTIGFAAVGGWFLGMRNMMITTIFEDYVLLAEAKGLSRWRVMLSYGARNAMLPQVASVAISLGSVVGGSLLAEIVFAYPGVGYLFYQAVTNLDYPLMQALFLAISLSVLVANFIADSVYVLLDPRTRETA